MSNKNIFIIDWDDTLFPTTWINSNTIDLENKNSVNEYKLYFIELDNHPDKDGYCDNRNIGTYSLEDEDGIALDVNKNFCCNKWEVKK